MVERCKKMSEEKKGPSKLISQQVPNEQLKQDLEHFRVQALDLGASLAEIIPSQWAEIDERVRLKCAIPLCPYYGTNIHCPPNAFEPELMRKALSRYHSAILFGIDVIPVEEFADRSVQREAGVQWSKKTIEIAGRIETLALGKGYYLAMGFSQGCCSKVLCQQDRCLVLGGSKCPYPLKSRPSMESVGIDVFRLVTRVGWDIYPIYRSVDPKEVPRALSVGIVFIY
jgi:predicted metal-binding protein